MDNGHSLSVHELQQQLQQAKQEINSLKLAVRAENLKVKISSEYSNFGLWEYDIADDICYQYKKLHGIYENDLEPIQHFRDTIISWGSIYSDDIPVFHKMCDAMERGDKEIYYDVRVVNDFSDVVWFRYEGKTVYDDNGNPVRIVGRTLDVTEEKGGVGISSDNRRDVLTGALVYESFKTDVEQRVSEKSFKSSALVIVGIDKYSDISADCDNDTDELQRSVAKVLEAQCAVTQGSLFTRIEDGMFAMYVRFSDIPALNAIIARVIYRFHNLRHTNNSDGKTVTVSAGVSVFKLNKNYDTVQNEAFAAYKAACAKGGNGYMQYNSTMLLANNMLQSDWSEPRVVSVAGAEHIYHLINTALTDKNAGYKAITEALREAGRYVGASQVHICCFGKNGAPDENYTPWNQDGKFQYDPLLPAFRSIYNTEKTIQMLSGHEIVIATKDRGDSKEKYGFEFLNGAESAVCCPIMTDDGMIGYVEFVANDIVTWQESDICLIEMLSGTLNHMFAVHYRVAAHDRRMSFAAPVINNLSIEGFSLVPDTFEVDYVGENAANSYGLKKGDICYRKIRGLDAPCADCPVHGVKAGQLTSSTAFYRESDGRWINIAASSYEVEGVGERYAVSTTDITNSISKIQTRDTLTGVLGFDRFAVDAMRIAATNPEGCFITVINIANFRRLNESMGYEHGNSVLIAVADILAASTGDNELLCRSEGARFIALHRNNSTSELHTRLYQMLNSAQGQVLEKCGIEIHLIAGVYELDGSAGIMTALDRAIVAQKTIKDKAYYTSNMISFYDNALNEEMQARQYVETHMLEALENNEFKVFYQPKVNTFTGKVVGAEALVRWIRPNGEIVSPGKFVPVFERNGFIADMDFAVYRSAVMDIKKWMQAGYDVPMVSLNVSRQHVRDDGFCSKICALVDSIGVPRDKIELEITESMLTENLNRLREIMTQLKEAGFRLSMDDFGSGYSSLSLITVMPFDTIKIDGSFFLRNALTDKTKAVITSVISLAKNLNFSTVSEGVETDEQVSFLKELECDMVQGYYFYKPMASADYEQLIK